MMLSLYCYVYCYVIIRFAYVLLRVGAAYQEAIGDPLRAVAGSAAVGRAGAASACTGGGMYCGGLGRCG